MFVSIASKTTPRKYYYVSCISNMARWDRNFLLSSERFILQEMLHIKHFSYYFQFFIHMWSRSVILCLFFVAKIIAIFYIDHQKYYICLNWISHKKMIKYVKSKYVKTFQFCESIISSLPYLKWIPIWFLQVNYKGSKVYLPLFSRLSPPFVTVDSI